MSSIERYHFPVERSINVCGSYAHFNVFPYKFQLNENAKALCLYCTDSKGANICVKAIQWDKLWYDFPIFTVSHYREQTVSFKKVDLLESLSKVKNIPSLASSTCLTPILENEPSKVIAWEKEKR